MGNSDITPESRQCRQIKKYISPLHWLAQPFKSYLGFPMEFYSSFVKYESDFG